MHFRKKNISPDEKSQVLKILLFFNILLSNSVAGDINC